MDEIPGQQKLRVLLLEDNAADAELNIRELRKAGYEPEWKSVQTEDAFLAALDDAPDLVLSDYSLPQFDGLRALNLLRTRGLDTPFILISGVLGEDFVVTAIQNGADDYVVKDRLARLSGAVAKALKNKQLRNEFRQVEAVRLENEARVRELAESQSAILNAVSAHIALLDAQGVIIAVNDSWKRFATANRLQGPQFAVGINYLDVCERAVGEDLEEARAAAVGIRRVLCGEVPEFAIEYPCHSESEQRWFRLTVNPLSDSQQSGAVVLHVNITGRKLSEIALRKSEQEQRHLAQQLESERSRLLEAQAVAKVGSWETDLATLSVTWSEETFRIFETTPDQFHPTHPGFLEHVHHEDRAAVNAAFMESKGQTGPFTIEHRLLLAGGKIKFVEERWQMVRDEQGNPIRAIGTCQDITERRSLQQQLGQSQKMEAVGQLAGGVAHDFNNLLTVMLGYSEVLMSRIPAADPAWTMLSDIHQSAERASNLTRQLLAFSRKQVLSPKVLDLNVVVSGIGRMLGRLIGEDVALNCVLGPLADWIKVDPGQLEQVIINLAVNARDAMPRGGKLTIETAAVDLDEHAALHLEGKPGRYVALTMADTGCGMSAEVRLRIFEPFFTTKGPGKGTGLGLATVFGIVKQSGGLIDLESQEGVGTRFQILFPAVSGKTNEPVKEDASAIRGNETILLVEDEDIVRKVSTLALESHGYKTLLAANGPEAIRIVESNPEGTIQLVVTDVVMPGMSGRVLVEQLRRDHPGLKFLFVSGYTDDAVVKHGVFEARDAFLQKPFTPRSLVRKVREILDS